MSAVTYNLCDYRKIRKYNSWATIELHVKNVNKKVKLKSQGCLKCLRTEKSQCLEDEVDICNAKLLSVSRQVGAHLWHEDPTGGL